MIYLIALLTFPVLTALGAYVFKNRQPGLWLLLGAVGHCGLSILVCRNPEANSFLGITSGSDITLLSLTSILYLSVCVYLYSFLYNSHVFHAAVCQHPFEVTLFDDEKCRCRQREKSQQGQHIAAFVSCRCGHYRHKPGDADKGGVEQSG